MVCGGTVTENTFIREVSKCVFSQQQAITVEDISKIYLSLCKLICLTLKSSKSVLLPGLGTFKVSHRLHASCVYPSESLFPVFIFGTRYSGQRQDPLPPGHHQSGNVPMPNYAWIESDIGLPMKIIKRVVAELMRALGKHVLAGRSVDVEFCHVGKLQRVQKDKTLRFLFYTDLLWPPLADENRLGGLELTKMDRPKSAHTTQSTDSQFGYYEHRKPKVPVFTQKAPMIGLSEELRQHVPSGLARVWEACLKEDKVKHGWVSRLFFERVAHGLCRHTLTGVGGATIMDLMEAHAVGKTGAFVKYQPLLTSLVGEFHRMGVPEGPDPMRPELSSAAQSDDQSAGNHKHAVGSEADSRSEEWEAHSQRMRNGSLGAKEKREDERKCVPFSTVKKEALKGGGCMVEDDALFEGVPYPRFRREQNGNIGPKRDLGVPPTFQNAAMTVTNMIHFMPDEANRIIGNMFWEGPQKDPREMRALNLWNLEHSERVRRMRKSMPGGITPKVGGAKDQNLDIMMSNKWAQPRPENISSRSVHAEHSTLSHTTQDTDRRDIPQSGGALRDLVGGDVEVVDLSKTRDRYFIPTVGKFGGKFNCDVGTRDEELAGRTVPRPYEMGFKRPTNNQQIYWAERREVDEFNKRMSSIKAESKIKGGPPQHPSNNERQYVPTKEEPGWRSDGVTPKVTDLSWDRHFETTYNARTSSPLKDSAMRALSRSAKRLATSQLDFTRM